MTPASMEGLPAEVLCHISYFIDTHRPSLQNFALASKICHTAALSQLRRCISFDVSGRKQLQRDVERWLDVLSRSQTLKDVRKIVVAGHMPSLEHDKDEPPEWELDNDNYYGYDEIFGISEDTVFVGDWPKHVDEETDQAWQPLAALLRTLPHVSNLIWKSGSIFPPCILNALSKHHPDCRLNIKTFRFRSLHEDQTDPHELAIATSPNLHAITVRHTYRDSSGNDDWNEEAVLRTVGGLAPCLKKVRMVYCRPASSPELMRSRGRPRQPWSGFKPQLEGRHLTELTSLGLSGYPFSSPEKLENWRKHTIGGLSTLRKLDLSAGINGETMSWVQANIDLVSLKELNISLNRDDESIEKPSFEDAAVAFFGSLRPLNRLNVSGSLEPSSLSAALVQHGSTLRKLSITPFESMYSRTRRNWPMVLTLEHVKWIQESCPLLEGLRLPVKRSKGSVTETQMYQALGAIPRLEYLFLVLDCSDPAVMLEGDETPNDKSFDEFDQRFFGSGMQRRERNGHVRDSYTNSAVDVDLAVAILNTIKNSKGSLSGPVRPLQSLKITTQGGASFGHNSYNMAVSDIIHNLARSYLLERSARDDSDAYSCRELGERSRKARDAKQIQHEGEMKEKWGERKMGTEMEIFRRIWPSKGGGWRDEWSSWPLQTEREKLGTSGAGRDASSTDG